MPINPNAKGEISGESLFGDAGSPEALAIIYGPRKEPEPKERFSGLKSLLGKLKKAFSAEAPKDGGTCPANKGICPAIRHSNFRNFGGY